MNEEPAERLEVEPLVFVYKAARCSNAAQRLCHEEHNVPNAGV